jgi:hypothetical protein
MPGIQALTPKKRDIKTQAAKILINDTELERKKA